MAYDLEEQEQIDELKSWWSQYGNLVTAATTAALLTVAAFQGWAWYKKSRAVEAVTLYEQMGQAERDADHKKVRDIGTQIMDKYGSTAYATMAALAGAKAAFITGDLAAARTQLKWAIDNTRDDEIRDVARMRLAGVLLDEKNFDEALKILDAKPVESLTGLFAELKGDVLAVQGKNAEARGAYQLALDKSEANSGHRATIQLKLDALGEPAPAAK